MTPSAVLVEGGLNEGYIHESSPYLAPPSPDPSTGGEWAGKCHKVPILYPRVPVSVPSSELGLPHPFSPRKCVTPPPPHPKPKGGGTHSPAGEGVG